MTEKGAGMTEGAACMKAKVGTTINNRKHDK